MQMSQAKRRLSGPAKTLMTPLRHSKAVVWTVDDVTRLIEWIFKTFRPAVFTRTSGITVFFSSHCQTGVQTGVINISKSFIRGSLWP